MAIISREAINDAPCALIDSGAALETWLAANQDMLPLFAKPDSLMGSIGVFSISAYVDGKIQLHTGEEVSPEQLLEECYEMAERIIGFSQLGVEMSKQMLWAGVDAGSLHTHMNHEGHAQLFVRMTTQNFEEAIRARKEGRKPDYKD